MNGLNANGEDESQWFKPFINPKTGKREMPPIVNAFRAAKGDVILNDDGTHESPHWLPRIMFTKGRLSKEHYDMAFCFECVWFQAKKTLGVLELKGKLYDKMPEGEITIEVDSFLEIKRTISANEFREIIWFVSKYFPASDAALPLDRLGVILHGLENSKIIIDICKKKRENAKYTSPEVSLNSPLPSSA